MYLRIAISMQQAHTHCICIPLSVSDLQHRPLQSATSPPEFSWKHCRIIIFYTPTISTPNTKKRRREGKKGGSGSRMEGEGGRNEEGHLSNVKRQP